MRSARATGTIGWRIAYGVGIACLLGVMQLLAIWQLAGRWPVWLGAGSGLLAFGLWRLNDAPDPDSWEGWVLLPGTGLGILFGQGLLGATVRQSVPQAVWPAAVWAACAGVLVVAGLDYWAQRRRSARCQICPQPLGRAAQMCPRCGHPVCARPTCWNAADCRCADCAWLRRPLLLLEDESWWRTRLRARLTEGKCARCGKTATAQVDLRKCGKCPRAMCTQCWDWENGVCVKCLWVIPDLPAALQRCLAATREPAALPTSKPRTPARSRRDDAEIPDDL